MSVVSLQELKEKLERPDLYYSELGGSISDVERLANIQEIVWDELQRQQVNENKIEGYTTLHLTDEQIDAMLFIITQLQCVSGKLSEEWDRLTDDFLTVRRSRRPAHEHDPHLNGRPR